MLWPSKVISSDMARVTPTIRHHTSPRPIRCGNNIWSCISSGSWTNLRSSGPAVASTRVCSVAFRQTARITECVSICPTNGRADDQERRNHSTQYASFPDY